MKNAANLSVYGSMARPAGFEPTACRLGGDRSIQLSYGRTMFRQADTSPRRTL